MINTSDIDFVNNAADLENLVSVVRKMRKGAHHYLPLSSPDVDASGTASRPDED